MSRFIDVRAIGLAGLAIVIGSLCDPLLAAGRTYSGGPQIGIVAKTEDEAQTTNDTSFKGVPRAVLRWVVPARDRHLLLVKFTAECRLIGGNATSQWVELRARIVPSIPVAGYPKFLAPYDASGPMAFCADDNYEMHHAGWVEKLPRSAEDVTYTVQIQWRTREAANQAWLDDWLMELHVSGR